MRTVLRQFIASTVCSHGANHGGPSVQQALCIPMCPVVSRPNQERRGTRTRRREQCVAQLAFAKSPRGRAFFGSARRHCRHGLTGGPA